MIVDDVIECVKVKIITRPEEDFNGASRENMKAIYETLTKIGINLVFKTNLYKKFAVIDNKVVWYGGINLLKFIFLCQKMIHKSECYID